MSMITNLALQEKAVVGGEEIAVFKYQLANAHLFQLSELVSRLQMAMVEMDSNNSTGGLVLADSESINLDWARFKIEWELAKKYRHLPPNAQEKIFSVLAITDNEQLRTVNVRCRRVVHAISTLIYRMVWCDSAKLQYGISDIDIKRIEQQMAYVGELIALYVGEGTADKMGLEVAAHEHLGNVVPPINLHEATVQEPSAGGLDMPSGDAPDTPSTVPAPGRSTGKI